MFSGTKVQFLHADEGRPQQLLESPAQVDGLHVARVSDLMAMKLKVVGDRGELRDYFDLMTIEQRTGRMADEGLALFVERFQPEYPDQAINHILLGLGYFDDVDPDDGLPVPRAEIVDYWTGGNARSLPPAAADRPVAPVGEASAASTTGSTAAGSAGPGIEGRKGSCPAPRSWRMLGCAPGSARTTARLAGTPILAHRQESEASMADHDAAGGWDVVVSPWHLDEHLPEFPAPAGPAETVVPAADRGRPKAGPDAADLRGPGRRGRGADRPAAAALR